MTTILKNPEKLADLLERILIKLNFNARDFAFLLLSDAFEEVKEKAWEPEGTIWVIFSNGEILERDWDDGWRENFKFGNVFPTKEAAQEFQADYLKWLEERKK